MDAVSSVIRQLQAENSRLRDDLHLSHAECELVRSHLADTIVQRDFLKSQLDLYQPRYETEACMKEVCG